MTEEQSHGNLILQNFYRFQQEGRYCDITIVIISEKFRCHRFVLAAASGYFDSLFSSEFTEGTAPEISLTGVGQRAFQLVLQYMYTGKSKITLENAYLLLKTSDYLLMNGLKEYCMEFIEQNPEVCHILKIYNFALTPAGNSKFAEIAIKNAAINFWQTIKTREFLNIDFDLLSKIFEEVPDGICSYCGRKKVNKFQCWLCSEDDDNMNILRYRLTKWMKHRIDDRFQYFPKFTSFTNVDSEFLKEWETLIANYKHKLQSSFRLLSNAFVVLFVKSSVNQLIIAIRGKDDDEWSEYSINEKWIDNLKGVVFEEDAYCLTSNTTEDGTVNEFWKNDTRTIELQTPPVIVKEYALTRVNKLIYLYAYDIDLKVEPASSHIYAYIIQTNRWFQITPIPKYLYHSYFVSVYDTVLVIGGSTTYSLDNCDTKQKVLQRYDPSTSAWSEVPFDIDLTLKGAACSHDDEVFICEEIFTQGATKTRAIHTYDVVHNEWETIGLKTNATTIKSLTYHCERLWTIPSQPTHNIEVFDLQLRTWCELNRLPSPKEIHQCNYEIAEILDILIF